MNAVLPDQRTGLPRPVAIVPEAEQMRHIHRRGTDLVIWNRCRSALPTLPADWRTVGRCAFDAPTGGVERILIDALGSSGGPLARDVGALAAMFAEVAGVPAVSVRLEVIEDDACRRWHVDYKRLRLLCTYAGPGTLWCEKSTDGTIVAAGRQKRGSVGIYKGILFSGGPSGGLFHRSPRIAAAGRRRLTLCIDEAA